MNAESVRGSLPVTMLRLIILLLLTGAEPVLGQDAAEPKSDAPDAASQVAASPAAPVATDAAAVTSDQRLADALQPLIDAHRGGVGIAIKHLGRGTGFRYRADVPMPTASLIKLPLLAATFRQIAAGEVRPEETVRLTEEDKVPGSGILTRHFSAGAELPLRDALRLMIAYSDNTATNLVIDRVGLRTTATEMERIGLPQTKLHSKVYRRDTSVFPQRSERFGLGSTTADETVRLLEMIGRGEIVSREACDEMLEHLLACEDRNKLARQLPSGVSLAHKTGSINASRCDAGLLIGPSTDGESPRVAICVLTNNNSDRSWSDDNEAENLISEIGSVTCRHFFPDAYPPETEPSPPAPTTSGAESDTDDPSGEPLTGPPVVSCRAWAIGDGDSGELLAGHDAEKPLDNASTTKLMTAWLIARLAADDPQVLSERVTFSKRADETIGSSAELRAGESMAVGELIYGLLLPSGNDAAVAFAEHFGTRLRVKDDTEPSDDTGSNDQEKKDSSYLDFIDAMNRQAESLGLSQTRFQNPNGLTAEGHHSSAADLMKLGWHVVNDPLLAKIVGTRRYSGQALDPSGLERTVTWTNTNRLLAIDGYVGIKTGTTRAAGACLVAAGRRRDVSRIVVVLGSSGSDARYADTRNLFRWTWRNE